MYSIVYIYLINSRLDVTLSVRHHFRIKLYQLIICNNTPLIQQISDRFTDGPRREKANFYWHWLDATNDNPEREWRWTVKGAQIPLSETSTFWDYDEPSTSIYVQKTNYC